MIMREARDVARRGRPCGASILKQDARTSVALALGVALALVATFPHAAVAARPGADLVVRKRSDVKQARVGDSVTYTISVRNKGPATATGVLVGEDAPDELGVTSFSCNGGTHVPQFAFACSYESIAKGEKVSATFEAVVTSDAVPGDRITNTAFIAGSDTSDPITRNNQDSAVVVVVE